MEKQRNMKKIALTVLVIGFILYCAAGIDYSGLASFSPSMAKDVIKGLCAPKWDYFYDGSGEDVFSLLLLTIGIAFLGTAIATVLAIPLMLISAANLWKGCPVVPRIGKLICNILRAFPELVYAIIFVKMVWTGTFCRRHGHRHPSDWYVGKTVHRGNGRNGRTACRGHACGRSRFLADLFLCESSSADADLHFSFFESF